VRGGDCDWDSYYIAVFISRTQYHRACRRRIQKTTETSDLGVRFPDSPDVWHTGSGRSPPLCATVIIVVITMTIITTIKIFVSVRPFVPQCGASNNVRHKRTHARTHTHTLTHTHKHTHTHSHEQPQTFCFKSCFRRSRPQASRRCSSKW
jgi:hypothetical protein